MTDRVLEMADVVRRSISEKDECPIVIDLAGFCLSTLEPETRRDPSAMLGSVYDWMRGVWQNGVNPERENRPAYLLNASLAQTFEDGSKPKPIIGDSYAAAMLAATLPAAFGIKTRLAFGGNGNGWDAVWAEAKTSEKVIGKTKDGKAIVEDVFGAHLDLYGGLPIGDVRPFSEYGTADIFDGWIATIPQRAQEARLNAAPPTEGEHFFTVLPDSWDGIKFELGRMRSYVKASVSDPLVIETAARIKAEMSAGDQGQEARLAAIYQWVRDRFIYRPDPIGTELVQSPQRMIRMANIDARVMGAILAPVYAARAGVSLAEYEVVPAPRSFFAADCDEAAVMCATLASSEVIGIPTEFALGGTNGQEGMHHVWVRAQINGVWGYDMDPTELEFESVGDHATMDKAARMSIWGRR